MNETGREKFNRYKKYINFLSSIISLLPNGFIQKLFLFFRNTTGKKGLLIRYMFIRNLTKKCGDNVSIHPNVYFFNLQNVELGSNISIHPMCYIEGAGGLIIGNNVSIAHATSILTTNHTWDDANVPIKYNKEILKKVIIEDDVWIGSGCRVLAGVILKKRTVLAAGAVLNKSFPSHSVLGGIPAKVIKNNI
ncbi:MAG: acyltransferase [Pedobacter sp.]|nr:MAG: acyltransferase [Pedobacter sp.]